MLKKQREAFEKKKDSHLMSLSDGPTTPASFKWKKYVSQRAMRRNNAFYPFSCVPLCNDSSLP
jgi:hypothetical protein